MTSTAAQLGPEFTNKIIGSIFTALDIETKNVYQLYWNALISFLIAHWVIITVVMLVILLAAIIRAIMGRWGMLGSILYNYLYLGILLIIGLIWGSDIFVSDIFNFACTVVLYPTCYFLVGVVLNKTGLRRS